MMRLRLLILLFMVAQGCTCKFGGGGGGCETPRSLKISKTAPANGKIVGGDQKFGFTATDSENDPESLAAAVRVDNQKWIPCRFNDEADQVIEETASVMHREKEYAFRCPVTATTLAGGSHVFVYSVDGARNGSPARATTGFSLDSVAPVLTLNIKDAPGQNTIAFHVGDEADFDSVALYVNKVRVTTSYEKEGDLIVDSSIRGQGATVEVRAYDQVGNFSSTFVQLR